MLEYIDIDQFDLEKITFTDFTKEGEISSYTEYLKEYPSNHKLRYLYPEIDDHLEALYIFYKNAWIIPEQTPWLLFDYQVEIENLYATYRKKYRSDKKDNPIEMEKKVKEYKEYKEKEKE